MASASGEEGRRGKGIASAYLVPVLARDTARGKEGTRCHPKRKGRAVILALTLLAFASVSLIATGCGRERAISREELSSTMQRLCEAMRKALSMDPYSWPEYQAYLASDPEDYELIKKRVEEAYAVYDEVLSYVDSSNAGIGQSTSAEILKEVENLRNYVYLSVDYAYIVLNMVFTEIKENERILKDFSKGMSERLQYYYWTSFVDEYNRICEKYGLEGRLEYEDKALNR